MSTETSKKLLESVNNQINNILNDTLSKEKSYNYSPILHRILPSHKSVKLTSRFKADSDANSGQISYATFWRHPSVAVAHDGVGIAWSLGDGNKYNVYLVDNDSLNDDVFISNKIIREDVGINTYISGAKFELLPDTWYEMSLKITETYSMVGKIWKTGVSEPADDASPSSDYIILTSGAKLNPYRSGVESDYHFGLSVANTAGGEWFYDDIEILNLESGYPFAVFKMNTNPTNFSGPATIKYYGYGYDQEGTEGAVAYILKNDDSWEVFGTNTSSSTQDVTLTEIKLEVDNIADYRSADNNTYVAVRPSGSVGEKNLYTYYVGVENMVESGTQTGNVADMWIEAPEKIVETTANITSSDGTLTLNNTNVSVPLQEIVSITDSVSQILSKEDWELRGDYGKAYSIYPEHQVLLSGDYASSNNEVFTLTYRYYSDGVSMQTYLQGENLRVPGANNYIKIIPPYVLQFDNFQVKSNLSLDQIKQFIKDFIYSLDKKFEVSDLFYYLYNKGISYIDTESVDIKIRGYDYRVLQITDQEEQVNSRYIISGLGAFYTHTSDLIGVSKLDE